MKVTVFRWAPAQDEEGYYQDYEVPVVKEEKWTVMDVLDHIALKEDSSLSYYRHSVCNQGVCARCSVRINGKAALACATAVEADTLLLEPRSKNIVKDLVVK